MNIFDGVKISVVNVAHAVSGRVQQLHNTYHILAAQMLILKCEHGGEKMN